MRERNFYKIDDYLIITGSILITLFLPFMIALIGALGRRGKGGFFLILVLCFIGFSPFIMIGLGLYFRSKEKKLNQFANLLETVLDIDAGELIKVSGMNKKKILEGIQRIENTGEAFYVWDENLFRVYDRRLKSKYVFVDSCPSCGGKLGKEFSLIMEGIPTCHYCGNPFSLDYWNNLKHQVMDSISKNNLEKYRIEMSGKSNLNKPLLIFLFMFFWPLGIYYLMKEK
ncbi:MAG: hypothetical protein H7A25_11800 [Leptospiraceae bacterium]|nr:hypothetical protein [Leptospiraceae bacterium]MCP5500581.1 hypothetical protein [Leptospiraceae bacterium]